MENVQLVRITLFMNSFVFVSVSKLNNKCTIENTPVLNLDVSLV